MIYSLKYFPLERVILKQFQISSFTLAILLLKVDLAMSPYQALIFGASGITGWSLMRECLTYPTKDTFSRVIGLTNRPLNPKDAMLPDDSRWELHSGMDLTKDVEDVVRLLKGIEGIEKTTHVYFACMMMAFCFWTIANLKSLCQSWGRLRGTVPG